MNRSGQITIYAILASVLLSACNPLYGFIESEFHLAPDSRLPRWFKIPSGYTREGLDITITLYTHPFLNKAKMVVYALGPEQKSLLKRVGDNRWHPCTERQFEEKKTGAIYPNYSIITVDGIEEIFEQRKPEDILYITDDPQLQLTMKQC